MYRFNLRCIAIIFCLMLVYCPKSHARDVTLQWDPNIEQDLAGYKLYYGTNGLDYAFDGVDAVQGESPVSVGNFTEITLNGLDRYKTYYFAVTAVNGDGFESLLSNVVMVQRDILLPGDMNEDTVIDISDALFALRVAVGILPVGPDLVSIGDVAPLDEAGNVSGDGRIAVDDVLVILRKSIGLGPK